MILIISQTSDGETDRVTATLEAHGVSYARIDTDRFLGNGKMVCRMSAGYSGAFLSLDNQCVDINAVRTVWYRRQTFSRAVTAKQGEHQSFIKKEYRHFISGVWQLLEDRFWINPLRATESAELKPWQLKKAQSLGFRVPKTLMTNDPDEVLVFLEECQGKIVYKTFSQYVHLSGNGKWQGIYTTPVERQHLLSRLGQIRLAPCLFQEYVPKKVELRVAVIGQEIFTLEVDAQKSVKGKDDWRRYESGTVYRQGQLPEEVAERIHELMADLGLVFGSIDIIVTPDNEYVFLEINPMGQSLWMQTAADLPILDRFVNLLTTGGVKVQPTAGKKAIHHGAGQ